MTFFTRLMVSFLGMAFAVVVAMGVLCWLALYVAYATLRWLLTGQKPQVWLMWQQIQAMRQGMQAGQGARWSSWSRTSDGQWRNEQGYSHHTDAHLGVIEDVVVREVHEKRSLPRD